MDLMQRRRAIMMQGTGEHWDYVFVFNNLLSKGQLISVSEGQTMTIEWDCPNGNSDGWVMNGNSLCENIARLAVVGYTGKKENIAITASGQVRIGSYTTNNTFAVRYGTIKVRLQ